MQSKEEGVSWRGYTYSKTDGREYNLRIELTNEKRMISFLKLHPDFDGLTSRSDRIKCFSFWYNTERKQEIRYFLFFIFFFIVYFVDYSHSVRRSNDLKGVALQSDFERFWKESLLRYDLIIMFCLIIMFQY